MNVTYKKIQERLEIQNESLCNVRSTFDWTCECLRQISNKLDDKDRCTVKDIIKLLGMFENIDLRIAIENTKFFSQLFKELQEEEEEELQKRGYNIKGWS